MALQNFVNQVGPPIGASWLNGVDVAINQTLGGGATPSAVLQALGLGEPFIVANGGTGATTASQALANLGGTTLTAVEAAINATFIGGQLYPQSAAEQAAGVTPTNYSYIFGDLRRYGAVGGPSGAVPTSDDSVAFAAAVSTGNVIIPQGFAFKVVTGATFTGQIYMRGSGPTSQLYCDSSLLKVLSGTGSIIDNVWLGNITTPYIITRNPLNWTASLTPAQSNGLGYQPTPNDPEYATWVAGNALVGSQNIGPVVGFSGAASNITVSRIYGRFVTISIQDAVRSTVSECDFQGGKGLAGIVFDNCSNNVQQGVANRIINNRVYYCSYSGIAGLSQYNFRWSDNQAFGCGESGLKTWQATGETFTAPPTGTSATLIANYTGPTRTDYGYLFDSGEIRQNVTMTNGSPTVTWTGALAFTAGVTATAWGGSSSLNYSTQCPCCFYGQIVDNYGYNNYYEGLDLQSTFSPGNGSAPTFHTIEGNYSYLNYGAGMATNGQYNNVSDNMFRANGTWGLLCPSQNTRISGNTFIDDNQRRSTGVAEISSAGGASNQITDNFIFGASGQNSPAILTTGSASNYIANNYGVGVSANNVGNVGSRASVLVNNVDNNSGAATPQSFCFILQNSGGTLQHVFYADAGASGTGNFDRITGATSGAFTTTPTGTDSSTAFAAGAKIGSASTNAVWFNTAAQPPTGALMLPSIVLNSTGTALSVSASLQAININGAAVTRLVFLFTNSTSGASVPLNTTNIPASKAIYVQFYGNLS